MKENIEEDIVLLNDFIEGNFQRDKLENYKGQYKMGYFYCKNIQQAIKHILSDYKRVLKENEELKHKYDKALSDVVAGVYLYNTYIPKQKIKDKIEELENDIEDYTFYKLTSKDIRKTVITNLQDLLEEKGE